MKTEILDIFNGHEVNLTGLTIINTSEKVDIAKHISKVFTDCTFIDKFKFSFTGGSLKFVNCEFRAKSNHINYKGNAGSVDFQDSDIQGSLELENCGSVNIDNTDISEDLNFGSGEFRRIIIRGREKKKIREINFNPHHYANGNLEIRDINSNLIEFSRSIPEKVRIWGGDHEEIKFSDAQNLKNFQIFGNEETKERIKIKKLVAHYLNVEGDILIKDAIIDNLDFTPFNMKSGTLRFQNVDFIESFICNQSNLGNAQFIGVNFLTARLQLNWTLFSEATYASIVWPTENLVFPNLVGEKFFPLRNEKFKKLFKWKKLSEQDHLNLKVQREAYRQLKVISENNKNFIDSLAFYKNEMRVYWKDMRSKRELNYADHFLVFLNRHISNFGQSYTRPLFLLLVFHFIFFCSIMNWNLFNNNFKGEFEFGQYWYLLNPIHKTPDYISTGMGNFTEFLMRVVGGYFIYHFIKATRKFGKV